MIYWHPELLRQLLLRDIHHLMCNLIAQGTHVCYLRKRLQQLRVACWVDDAAPPLQVSRMVIEQEEREIAITKSSEECLIQISQEACFLFAQRLPRQIEIAASLLTDLC